MSDTALADRRVHPGTVGIRFLKDLPQTLIGLPALLALMSDVGWGRIALLALLAALVLGFTQWLAWSRFRYGVGEAEIRIESGLFSRNRRSIPFERIQDLDIEQGPLHRLFGLAKVKIETGAGGKDEGVLDSITLAEADRLRRVIRAGRGVRAPDDASVESASEADSRVVFQMSPGRVFVSGLFNFSLVWVAGLFGLLQTFEPLIPFSIRDPGRWLGLVDAGAERFTLGAIAAVLLLAIALGVISGLLSTFGRDWNFRLASEGKRFRRTSGLLTRREAVIPKPRVQLALLRTGPVRHWFGVRQLLLQTLGSSKGQGGLQSAAPLARTAEVEGILAELPKLRLPGDTPLERVSSRHILRVAVRSLVLPAGVILGLATRRPEALALLALLPIFLGSAILHRNLHRYGVADGLLFIQESFWKRRLWAVPMASAQSVSIRRSWLQRRLGLATVTIDTAGAPVLGGPRITDIRVGLAQQLRDQILRTRPA